MKTLKTFRLYSYLVLFLLPGSLFAEGTVSNGFLYPDFAKGEVLLKDGTRVSANLNYYYLYQTMVFKDKDNAIMEFSDPASVVAIKINERFFVNNGKNAFYEQVAAGNGFYYIQWFAKVVSQAQAVAYGTSELSSVTNTSSYALHNSGYQNINLNKKVEIKIECIYYLEINNKYKKIDSAKALDKLFKGHESEIESFVKEQKIDFGKASDISKIAEFCNKFSK